MTVLIGILGAVLGALAGAVATYGTTRSAMRLELEHSYDRVLRDRRLERYQHLFHLSGSITWQSAEVPQREDLVRLRRDFRDWYFAEHAGGMYLTSAAKDLYVRTHDTLVALIISSEKESHLAPKVPLPADGLRELRRLVSDLRHQLAEDVGAAQPPRLRWTRLTSTTPPAATMRYPDAGLGHA